MSLWLKNKFFHEFALLFSLCVARYIFIENEEIGAEPDASWKNSASSGDPTRKSPKSFFMVSWWRIVNFILDVGFRRFARSTAHSRCKAWSFRAARDRARITTDQLKARRNRRESVKTWRMGKIEWEEEGGWREDPRERVCAGGTKWPAANIARNTVIAANISRKTPNSRRPPREISLYLDSRRKGCKRYRFSRIPPPSLSPTPSHRRFAWFSVFLCSRCCAIPVGNLARMRCSDET